jgi:hypothetical protein
LDKERTAEKIWHLLYLKSILQHTKSLSRKRRIRPRSKFQELLSQQLEEMKNSTSLPAYSASVPNIHSQMEDLAYSDWERVSEKWLNENS